MSKHIILGDVHLGKGLSIGKPGVNGKLNSRVQDQLGLLEWVLNEAIVRKVDNIIITGDVYDDPRPHPAIIQMFMTWLKCCEKNGIRVDVIVGNHDIMRSGAYSLSALDIIPAVELTHANIHKNVTTVHYDGVSFTFLPYRDRRMYDAATPVDALELLKAEFKNEPGTINPTNKKVLIGHLALEGSLYIGDEVDDMLNEIFCPLSIFGSYDYVWMGHIHKPQVLLTQPNYVSHIGSMDRSDFSKSELDHKKILILIDTREDQFFEEIILPVRQLRKVEISVPFDKDTTDFIVNSLYAIDHEESIRDATVRLEVTLEGTEAVNSDRDKIFRYAYEHLGVHHICNFSETRNIVVVPVQKNDATVFDNNMSVSAAIEAFYVAAGFESEEDRAEAKQLALLCYQEMRDAGQIKKDEAA